jgi:SAM-dependent methyltransferase
MADHDLPGNLRRDAFRGAAEVYARYRPPYPPELLVRLLARTGVEPGAVLVDLATGPGRIALDLAPSFERVIAIDVEPEMITVARRRASERGIENIDWHVGRAEDLEVAPGSVTLVTIGEAFHRLDQHTVARNALRWLKPGGALAVLGTFGHFLGSAAWEVAVRQEVARGVARAFPAGISISVPGAAEGPPARKALLIADGFADVDTDGFEATIAWTFDGLLGYLASTSTCSAAALGDDFVSWADDLRAAVAGTADSRFVETIEWEYLFGRKPR